MLQNRKFYQVLAALWFLLWGLLTVTSFTFALANPILGFLAIAVAILFVMDR